MVQKHVGMTVFSANACLGESELKQLRRVIAACECSLNVLWGFAELKPTLPFFVTQIFYPYPFFLLFFFSLAAEVSFTAAEICIFVDKSASEPIMANTNAVWQQAVHTTYQLSFPCCSTKALQKSLTPKKNYLRVFQKKVRKMDH